SGPGPHEKQARPHFSARLISIDGSPIPTQISYLGFPSGAAYHRIAEAARRGTGEVALEFSQRGKPVRLFCAPGTIGATEILIFFGLCSLAGLFVLWSGMAVFFLAGRREGARAYFCFSVFTFCFFVSFFDYHTSARLVPVFTLASLGVTASFAWLAFH